MAFLTAAEALKWALEIEKNGEAFYNEVAAKSADPEAKALFEDLAAQERGHYQAFQKMLEEVKPDPDLSKLDYEEYQAYLPEDVSVLNLHYMEEGACQKARKQVPKDKRQFCPVEKLPQEPGQDKDKHYVQQEGHL